MRRIVLLASLLLLSAPSPADAQAGNGCIGETSAANVVAKPGAARLRFGITPGIQTGQLGTGPSPPRLPEDPAKTLAALRQLHAPGTDLVLRLHRFFWSDGEDGVKAFLALAARYTAQGFDVELQLRYHPSTQQEGDIAAWVAFVRDVVRRFGTNPRVVAIQVTNEVNLTFSPDSSDGSYSGARDALVQGVIAAKDEALKIGSKVQIGFNWAYRVDPAEDTSFWQGVRDKGGPAFVRALDWIGLDAYPGTFFPPYDTPGGEADAMVNAMDSLRCFAAIPGIPPTVPIHIEENGWPTSPARSEAQQVAAMDTMVEAVDRFRGTYNVSDYRWFNLRDGDSTSPNYGVRYGLLHDDYSPKPAFGEYAALIRRLARPADAAVAAPRLRARCTRRTVRAAVTGTGVRAVRFAVGRRHRTDRAAPFAVTLRRPRRATRVRARVQGPVPTRLVRLLHCPGPRGAAHA